MHPPSIIKKKLKLEEAQLTPFYTSPIFSPLSPPPLPPLSLIKKSREGLGMQACIPEGLVREISLAV